MQNTAKTGAVKIRPGIAVVLCFLNQMNVGVILKKSANDLALIRNTVTLVLCTIILR